MRTKRKPAEPEVEAELDPRLKGRVVYRPLAEVDRNPWNPNRMAPRKRESLRRGLQEEGWLVSHALLVWGTDERGNRKNLIIDGEHRWTEAKALGFKVGPMVFLDGITEAQARALTVKLIERHGESDDAALSLVIRSLPADLLDATSLGLDDDRLLRLKSLDMPPLGNANDVDQEEVEIPTKALVKKWKTALGQLWVVPSVRLPGHEHRLQCADCRVLENVKALRGSLKPKLGLHDPPYGIDIVSTGVDNGKAKGTRFKSGGGVGDGWKQYFKAKGQIGDAARRGNMIVRRGEFAPIEGDQGPFDPAHLLAAAPPALVLWGANHYADKLPPSSGVIVWDKRVDKPSNDFGDGELAWVSPNASGRLRIIRHRWIGLDRASERGEKRLHPTQKPVAVQRQIVEWHTKPGDVVEDWYMGAGGVILACEDAGRVGLGMDIAPDYLAATLERLSKRGLVPRLVK